MLFWFVDSSHPLVVPVAIYSHHLLCFYHLQKGLASGGGAAAVAWKSSWLLATVSAGPAAQNTKPVPLRSHSSSQQISVESLLSTRLAMLGLETRIKSNKYLAFKELTTLGTLVREETEYMVLSVI